jgi:hypothetical protein
MPILIRLGENHSWGGTCSSNIGPDPLQGGDTCSYKYATFKGIASMLTIKFCMFQKCGKMKKITAKKITTSSAE